MSSDRTRAMAIIPGVSLSASDPHAFVQIIDGRDVRSEYFRFPISQFSADTDRFGIMIGKNTFSSEGMNLELDNGRARVSGSLRFADHGSDRGHRLSSRVSWDGSRMFLSWNAITAW